MRTRLSEKKFELWGVIKYSIFFFKQRTAYEVGVRLVGSEMCIRDRLCPLLILPLLKTARCLSGSRLL